MPSLRRPMLVPGFAERLAILLGLPYASVIKHQVQHPPQTEMRNSFQQADNVLSKFTITNSLKGKPILLVDDIADSKWTLTVVGDLLQRNGSGSVFPFTLAVTNVAE
jgi:ATP-dependent DNA helicase RecQ